MLKGDGKRALIVDDEAPIRNLLAILLQREGYQVHLASNGIEAVEEWRRTHFDVVIADYRMPELDGVRLALLGRMLWPETPVILLSGEVAFSAEWVREVGTYACLPKPFATEELLDLVGRAVTGATGERSSLACLGSSQ